MGCTVGKTNDLPRGFLPYYQSEAEIERAGKIITDSFAKLESYAKVIVGLGYAALLAIWSATKQALSERSLILSGMLILISILVYVFWEVGQNFFLTLQSSKWNSSVQKEGLKVAISRAAEREKRYNPWLTRFWLAAFVISAVSGFGAAGILVYAFCLRLFKLP